MEPSQLMSLQDLEEKESQSRRQSFESVEMLSKSELCAQEPQNRRPIDTKVAGQNTGLTSKVMNMAHFSSSSVSQLLHQPSHLSMVKPNAWFSDRDMQGLNSGSIRTMRDMAPTKQSLQTDVGQLPRQRSIADVTFGQHDTLLDGKSACGDSSVSPEETADSAHGGNAAEQLPDPSDLSLASRPGQQFSTSEVPLLNSRKPGKNNSISPTTSKSGISLKAAQLVVQFSVAAEHAASDAKPLPRANAQSSISKIQDETKQLLDRMKRDSSMHGVKVSAARHVRARKEWGY
eukprot:3766533-Rhodomonas_salina.1